MVHTVFGSVLIVDFDYVAFSLGKISAVMILYWKTYLSRWICIYYNEIYFKHTSFEQISYFMWQLYPKCIFVDFFFNTKNVLEARLSHQNFSQFLWPFFPQLWLFLLCSTLLHSFPVKLSEQFHSKLNHSNIYLYFYLIIFLIPLLNLGEYPNCHESSN